MPLTFLSVTIPISTEHDRWYYNVCENITKIKIRCVDAFTRAGALLGGVPFFRGMY